MMMSILCATYNQPITTKWLLLSLLDQQYSGEVEFLIYDDGSTTDLLPAIRIAS